MSASFLVVRKDLSYDRAKLDIATIHDHVRRRRFGWWTERLFSIFTLTHRCFGALKNEVKSLSQEEEEAKVGTGSLMATSITLGSGTYPTSFHSFLHQLPNLDETTKYSYLIPPGEEDDTRWVSSTDEVASGGYCCSQRQTERVSTSSFDDDARAL